MNILSRSAVPWFWIPGLAFIALIAAEILVPDRYYIPFVEENGPLEIVQFLLMGCAFFCAMRCLRSLDWKKQKFLAAWFGAAALACLFIAGEEISWGQQFFRWATPESWSAINDQNETNLHNTSAWLDQKPRLLLEIGVIVGGLLMPLAHRMKIKRPAWIEPVAPPDRLAFTAFLFLVIKIADKLDHVTDAILFSRGSEITEAYVYYFVLLYMACFSRREI